MIHWLLRNRMGLAFALAAGFLVAIAVIAISAHQLTDQYQTVRHTTQVLAELDGVLSSVTDAQTGLRGLLVTGDERYLTPYLTATEAAQTHLRTLQALSQGDARRRQRLDVLTPIITDTLGDLRETLQLRRERSTEAARQRVLTGRGPRLMEDVRSTVAAIKAEERGLLTEHSARHEEQARLIFLSLSTLTAVTFLILVILALESRRRAGEMRTTRDVLQTQVAEHEKTSSLLASIVRSSDDAVVGLGLDGRILTWNPGAEKLFGFREDEMRGRSLDVLFPAGRDGDLKAALSRVRTDQTIERFEVEHVAREGRRLRVLLTISPIRGIQDDLVGVSLVGHDFTARALAEEALRRSEATSRAFLESASEGIVVVDAAGRILLVNAKTEEMFDYPRAELVGQPLELLIPTRLRQAHAGHRAAYMAAPRVRSMGRGLDLAGLKKGGVEFPVEVSLSYVHTDEGTRAIAFVTDISERLAFQRAARQSDKLAALGTLSAGIAHEINNPIGIITSRVEVMMLEAEEEALPAEMRKDLEVILRHARRVAAITQGLLSFARRSSGSRSPVSLNRIVEEIVQLAQKDMSRAKVQVTVKLDESLPVIVADANAIGQVLLNLLTNARGAMPEGGEITVETGHLPDGRARLAVRDTGSGIPPEILPKIFDPFFTTKAEGTGLGLSISHGIVQEHHGTIDVRSEPGIGTTFILTFPLDVPAGA
jgi:PAS domain S-box-containing protein